ncbi:sensor histidine kinase [Actinokineospora iranica]|uniref:histidine kinase n=1 Tax=Actinokineospora iranica TaxID=1271860 RepID=A0A1G6IZ39_9PSEU|nr:sensor histidine kinase [Actinokineospora iranica]SDC11700.1 HAMP domain-containing protein [Actinokineospora iranica]
MVEEVVPRWSRDGKGGAQWPLRRWLSVTIGVLVLVFAGAVLAVSLAISAQSDERSTLVDRIDPAVQEALRLDTALVDQEAALRGFALTAREDFIAPYGEGVDRQDAAMFRLRELVGGHRGIAAELDRVQREADLWRSEYVEPSIERIRTSGVLSAERNAEGKLRFDQVRGSTTSLRDTLSTARDDGRASLTAAANRVVAVCVIVAAVLLAVFVLLAVTLRAAVARPLVQLATRVRRVADGDFQHALRVSGPREVTELSGDVDSMRRRILDEVAVQREINAELDSRTEDLKRSNAELEQFAYVASHDLQEPLRKVASFCQLLERRYKGQLDERADQYIGFAVDGAKRMQVLINDLLAFSRVGRHSREQVPVDCADLVAQARANLAESIEESGAEIEVGDLPTVLGETPLLTAVFQNLIGNAVKFRGAEPPRVRITAEREAEQWLFSVADNGIGIEAEFAERVFVIFQRLHSKEAYPGTGIGLAMCRKIIEYHGGRIWLDPEVQHGTRFLFTLPAIPEPVDNTESDPTEPEKAEVT